jgi:hypothetical protein
MIWFHSSAAEQYDSISLSSPICLVSLTLYLKCHLAPMLFLHTCLELQCPNAGLWWAPEHAVVVWFKSKATEEHHRFR